MAPSVLPVMRPQSSKIQLSRTRSSREYIVYRKRPMNSNSKQDHNYEMHGPHGKKIPIHCHATTTGIFFRRGTVERWRTLNDYFRFCRPLHTKRMNTVLYPGFDQSNHPISWSVPELSEFLFCASKNCCSFLKGQYSS